MARKKVVARPPPTVRVWPYKTTDRDAPQWPEDNYEVAKTDVFQVRRCLRVIFIEACLLI
jgi:hypothetical protein